MPVAVVLLAVLWPASATAQTPAQTLFGWATPPFPSAEYQERRARLMGVLAETGDVMVIPSGQGLSHGDTFRQLDDFSYLVGLELPRSALILDGSDRSARLFVPRTDHRFSNPSRPNDFPGRPLLTDETIADWLREASIADADGLGSAIDALLAAGRRPLMHGGSRELPGRIPDLFPSEDETEATVSAFMGRWGRSNFASGFTQMARTRAVKSPLEIATMERGARIAARSMVRGARAVAPGTRERALEGAFLEACKADGSQRAGFAPIIKSGPNALWPWRVLASHYDRRDRTLLAGDVVIFDVGCELDGYVSDVGRTFPVSGTFTDAQRRVLDMQVDVADAIIAGVRPGVTLEQLQSMAEAAIPVEEKPHMQVGLFFGHHLGLSTGDPVLTEEPLEAGMVFTVEPWYYNHVEGLSVFTEDEVLVTDDGARVLTRALPRRPAALEALMRSGTVHGLSVDPGASPPPAAVEEVVDRYAAAWNERDATARRTLLNSVWAPGGAYLDPTAHVEGVQALVAHIGGFQEGFPGGTIQRYGPVLRTGAEIFFRWEMLDPGGNRVATGQDAGELDVDGRIRRIVGFFDPPS